MVLLDFVVQNTCAKFKLHHPVKCKTVQTKPQICTVTATVQHFCPQFLQFLGRSVAHVLSYSNLAEHQLDQTSSRQAQTPRRLHPKRPIRLLPPNPSSSQQHASYEPPTSPPQSPRTTQPARIRTAISSREGGRASERGGITISSGLRTPNCTSSTLVVSAGE